MSKILEHEVLSPSLQPSLQYGEYIFLHLRPYLKRFALLSQDLQFVN